MAAVLGTSCRKAEPPPAAVENRKDWDEPRVEEPPRPRKAHFFNRVVALCIGIEQYHSPAIDPAGGCEKDARTMAAVFRDDYGYEPILLVGPDATKERILGHIDRLQNELGTQDALIVFFAGHGQVIELPDFGRAGYLVPFDATLDLRKEKSPATWAAQAIDMRALVKRAEKTPVQHTVFLVDSCCSGFMTKRGLLPAGGELMVRRSRSVLSATTERQFATPNPETGLGHFTGAVSDRLKSVKKPVTLAELFGGVCDKVIGATGGAMVPQRGDFGNEEGEFVFIPLALSSDDLRDAVKEINKEAWERLRHRTTFDQFCAVYDAVDYRHAPDRTACEQIWKEKFERFRENASAGDTHAQLALSLCYAKGLGTAKDPAAAFKFAKLALDSERPEARCLLAYYFFDGTGVEQNVEAALKMINDAEREAPGFPTLVAGDMVYRLFGRLDAEKYKLIRAGATHAASRGVKIAHIRAADVWIKTSKTIPADVRDPLLAELRALAKADNPVAQYTLTTLLLKAPTPPGESEKREALRWLTRAAGQGYAPAQGDLSVEYYGHPYFITRLGLKKDVTMATKWSVYAIAQEYPLGYKISAMLDLYGDLDNTDQARMKERYDQAVKLDPGDKLWQKAFNDELHRVFGIRYK